MADQNKCKCGDLFETVSILEKNGIGRKNIEKLADENNFNASRFGSEHKIANFTYAIISGGVGFAAGCFADTLIRKAGVDANIPRWIMSGGAGFISAGLFYTEAYVSALLCRQNSEFYDFLKDKYKDILDKKRAE